MKIWQQYHFDIVGVEEQVDVEQVDVEVQIACPSIAYKGFAILF